MAPQFHWSNSSIGGNRRPQSNVPHFSNGYTNSHAHQLFDPLNILQRIGLIEVAFSWSIKTNVSKPAFTRVRLYPVLIGQPFWFCRPKINRHRAVFIFLKVEARARRWTPGGVNDGRSGIHVVHLKARPGNICKCHRIGCTGLSGQYPLLSLISFVH